MDNRILTALQSFPQLELAIVFGSVAADAARPDSDLDIAIAARRPLSTEEKIAVIGALAEQTGRPVDLVDLRTTSEPLLGQIVRHGKRILGSDTAYGDLINRHLLEQADFMPYRTRILEERRRAWIGK